MARRRGSRGNRTRRGTVTAKARRRYAGRKAKGIRKGSFPVFDARSARAALRLRGHAKSKAAVISRVSRFASRTNNASLKAAVKRARAADRRRKR